MKRLRERHRRNLFPLHPGRLLNSPLYSPIDCLYRARKSTLQAALVLDPKARPANLPDVRLLRRQTPEEMAAGSFPVNQPEGGVYAAGTAEIALDMDNPEN